MLIYDENYNEYTEYTKYIDKVIYKEYWFFRELIDWTELDDEEIIKILKEFYNIYKENWYLFDDEEEIWEWIKILEKYWLKDISI